MILTLQAQVQIFLKILFTLLITSIFLNCTPKNINDLGAQKITNTVSNSSNNQFKTVKDYGAKGDGRTDDAQAIQAAIDSGNEVIFDRGIYLIKTPLIIKERILISGRKAQLTYTGNDAAIKANKLVLDVTINNLGIEVTSANAKAIDFTFFSYSHLNDLYLIVKGKNCTGLYMKGNGQGSGPYYNSITNLYIVGSNKPSVTGQRGIVLDGDPQSGLSADGANGNMFTNIKRIAGLSIAVDLIAGNGNIFSGVNTESIQDFHFRLNYRAPDFKGTISRAEKNSIWDGRQNFGQLNEADLVIQAGRGSEKRSAKIVGFRNGKLTTESHADLGGSESSSYEVYKCKALGNVFTNIRAEGAGKSVFAKFCHGATENRFENTVISSIGTVHYIRETNNLSNRVGRIFPLVFTASQVAPSTTIKLTPATAYRGGVPMAVSSYIDAIQIKNTKLNNPGTCTVNLNRNAAKIPLTVELGPSDRNTAITVTKEFIPTGYGLLRPNDGLQVSITTNAAWQKDDVIVTVWLTEN